MSQSEADISSGERRFTSSNRLHSVKNKPSRSGRGNASLDQASFFDAAAMTRLTRNESASA